MKETIFKFFALFTLLFVAISCQNEELDSHQYQSELDNSAFLILNVRSSENLNSLQDNEKMKSLRVILLGSTGRVENNEYFDFEAYKSEETLTLSTTKGKKTIFLIANEESVSSFSFDSGEYNGLLESKEQTFSSFLAGLSDKDLNCNEILNSIIVTPDYTKGILQSSSYEVDLKGGETKEMTLYVVKAAIKVTFTFKNSRDEEVKLNQVRISSLAKDLYLMGHVGSKDFTKEGQYWVDWLALTSADSQNYPEYDDNFDFHNQTGLITDYLIPETNHSMISFIEDNNPWIVPQQTTIENQNPEPGELPKGPYYFAESKNILNEETGVQQYYLSLNIQDGENNFTISRLLPNASALFRNSHVDIVVNMSKGATDIYVEIKSWAQLDEVYGTVDEENI